MKKRFWSKHYTAKELGLPYKGFKKIYIGRCGATDDHFVSLEGARAHTHVCKESKFYTDACFAAWYWLEHSTLLHELSHILDVGQHTSHAGHEGWEGGINSDASAHGDIFWAINDRLWEIYQDDNNI